MSLRRFILGLALSAAAAAQVPVVGDINFYGLHALTAGQLLDALDIESGSRLSRSKGALEDALEQVPGVSAARVEAVCCEGTRANLFIGIAEKDAPQATFREAPGGEATLPQKVLDAYSRKDVPTMAAFAAVSLDQLRDVLRNASGADQRAAAAAIVDYSAGKAATADDLVYALRDPDEFVRANALKSLSDIAGQAAKQPDPAVHIPPGPLIDLLNSIVLTDRMESTRVLLALVEAGDRAARDQVRERALPNLSEMARWKTPSYALPAYLLLGREAGFPESELRHHWVQGERETVIAKAAQVPSPN